MTHPKRPPVALFIIPLIVGLGGFFRVTHSPSFASYRTVDVVQLLGSGVCFGMVIVGVIFLLRSSHP